MIKIIRIHSEQGELVFDLFDKYRVFYERESDIDAAKKFIQARLSNNESIIFVALEESSLRPVGFTQLYPVYSSVRVSKNWLLNDLYIEKDFRKKGIGEALIRTAMDFAKNQHAKFVELSTATDNYTAQSLYEQIGFIRQAPETDFYTYRILL